MSLWRSSVYERFLWASSICRSIFRRVFFKEKSNGSAVNNHLLVFCKREFLPVHKTSPSSLLREKAYFVVYKNRLSLWKAIEAGFRKLLVCWKRLAPFIFKDLITFYMRIYSALLPFLIFYRKIHSCCSYHIICLLNRKIFRPLYTTTFRYCLWQVLYFSIFWCSKNSSLSFYFFYMRSLWICFERTFWSFSWEDLQVCHIMLFPGFRSKMPPCFLYKNTFLSSKIGTSPCIVH